VGEDGARHRVNRYLTPIAITLTFCSGAMDVAAFTRLGNVFSSVMTGNIVLCGLAIARGSVSLLLHTMTAVAGYVIGVAGGSRLGWYRAQRSEVSTSSWAPHARLVLVGELILLCALLTGWEVAGARPGGLGQYVLLAVASAAMGMQSSAVSQMGLTNVSTTYLTGTLTGLVGSLARPDREKEGALRPGVLAGLLGGAVLCGVLVVNAGVLVPVLPAGALVLALVLGARSASAPAA
jgi:uncharacterized membrane protein YoaK (UPF0700 family)